MGRERREEARCGDKGEEHMRKHEENNATDRGRQRGEHKRNLKDKRHSGAWKLKRHDTKT